MRQAGEPSVEEILELIKLVIARDNREGAAEERRTRETVGMPSANDSDDNSVDHTPSVANDDVLDLGDGAEYAYEDDFAMEDSDHFNEDDGAPPALVTEDSRMSMQDSLAALAMLSQPGAQPQIVRSGETSLEGLTRDLLRPMLADWLDKNLPPIVERLVAAEVARIAGKRG